MVAEEDGAHGTTDWKTAKAGVVPSCGNKVHLEARVPLMEHLPSPTPRTQYRLCGVGGEGAVI